LHVLEEAFRKAESVKRTVTQLTPDLSGKVSCDREGSLAFDAGSWNAQQSMVQTLQFIRQLPSLSGKGDLMDHVEGHGNLKEKSIVNHLHASIVMVLTPVDPELFFMLRRIVSF